MSAVEEIQQAIATLERLRAESTPGPWRVDDDSPTDIWTEGESVLGGTVHTVVDPFGRGDYQPDGDAALIVTLHRTIDAQLAWLTVAAELTILNESDWRHELALARAINGGQS